MEPYTAQDARSSGQPQAPVTTSQHPKISEINLVEEVGFSSSALDGVTVGNTEFTEVSMIEIFAVEKRKATRSGPDSDGSDRRIAKKVAQCHETSGAFPGRQPTGLHKPVRVSSSPPLRPRSRLRLVHPHLGLGLRPRRSYLLKEEKRVDCLLDPSRSPR
jgi:hypothetical protein